MVAMETTASGVYNVGSGSRITVNELASKIIELTGGKSKVIHGSPQTGDAEHTWASVDKAKEDLGWEPRIPHPQPPLRGALGNVHSAPGTPVCEW